MLSRIKTLLRRTPAEEIKFVPLCHVPPAEAGFWLRCRPIYLSDEGYERLHEFLQANLEGRWSLLPQDRDQLERYDVLLEVEAELSLLDLFRVTIGMRDAGEE